VQGKMLLDTASVLESKATVKTDTLKNAGDIKLTGTAAQLMIGSGVVLEKGVLELNSNKLLILNDDTNALKITDGNLTVGDSLLGSVIWNISNKTGKYVVPFSDSLGDVFVELKVLQAGDSLGQFVFSTYQTDNSNEPLPANMGDDAARMLIETPLKITDRFWKVEAANYDSLPAGKLKVTYLASETEGSNTITVDSLMLSRWDGNCWQKLEGEIDSASGTYQTDTSDRFGTMVLHERYISTLCNNGHNCDYAYFLKDEDYGNTVFEMTDTVMWFKFIATDTLFNFYFYGRDLSGLLGRMFLYQNNCDSLILLAAVNLKSDSAIRASFDLELKIGKTYFIMVESVEPAIQFTAKKRIQWIETDLCSWLEVDSINSIYTCWDENLEFTEGYCGVDSLVATVNFGNYVPGVSVPPGVTDYVRVRIWTTRQPYILGIPPNHVIRAPYNPYNPPVYFQYFPNSTTNYSFSLPPGNYVIKTDVTFDQYPDFDHPFDISGNERFFSIYDSSLAKPQVSGFDDGYCELNSFFIQCANCSSRINDVNWILIDTTELDEFYVDYFIPEQDEPIYGSFCTGSDDTVRKIKFAVEVSNEVCSTYAIDTFQIGIKNSIANFGFEAVCENDSIFYLFSDSSQCAQSWHWNFGDGTTDTLRNPIHHYSQSGIYNVTLAINNASEFLSCLWDTIIQEVIVRTPLPPVISGNLSACETDSVIYRIGTMYYNHNYEWFITGGSVITDNGDSIMVNWSSTAGGWIKVIDRFDDCISDTAFYQVRACCYGDSPDSNIVFGDITVSQFVADSFISSNYDTLSHTYQNANQEIVFNGVLIVDQNITFIKTNITFAPLARVMLNNGDTLILKDTDFHASDSCNFMWDGIYIQPEGMLIVEASSSISDALNAIVSIGGGNFNISASTLTENYKHIVVQSYDSIHPAAIYDSTWFTCPNTLMPPHESEKTRIAIQVDSVQTIVIGDTAFTRNNFLDADTVIKINRSGVSIINNFFGTVWATVIGTGIYAHNGISTNALANPYRIQIGGSDSIMGNNFWGYNEYAIRIDGYYDIDIKRNAIGCIFGCPRLRNGIYISNTKRSLDPTWSTGSHTEITANWIHSTQTGLLLTEINNDLHVGGNTFEFTNPDTVAQAGIILLNLFSLFNTQQPNTGLITEIEGNTISEPTIGILIGGKPYSFIGANDITVSDTSYLQFSRGIEMWNSYKSNVWCNNLEGSNNSDEITQFGISSWIGASNTYLCNSTEGFGRALNFAGRSDWTHLLKNKMDDARVGMALDYSGSIGPQGVDFGPYFKTTFDNEWDLVDVPDAHVKTYNSIGALSPFLLRNASDSINKWYPEPFNIVHTGTGFAIDTPSNTIPTHPLSTFCSPSYCPTPEEESAIAYNIPQARRIIGDSIPYQSDSLINRWWARYNLYISLIGRDSIFEQDSIIEDFVEEYKTTATAKLDSVRWEINELRQKAYDAETYNLLEDKLEDVQTSNDIDATTKEYSKRVLELLKFPNSNELKGIIEDIAKECVFYSGPSVVEARTFMTIDSLGRIGYNWEENCNSSQNKQGNLGKDEIQTIEEQWDYKLHPNLLEGSSDVSIYLKKGETGIVEVYDLLGEMQGSYKVSEGTNTLSLSKIYRRGLLIYRVIILGEIKTVDKLIILD